MGEREGQKHQCVVASHVPPTGHLASNPAMCPDWELNCQPFGSQAHAQSTEPHQPGQILFLYYYLLIIVLLSCITIVTVNLLLPTTVYWKLLVLY